MSQNKATMKTILLILTPVLSTEETIDSLSMGDEYLDTIPATESDKVIKSSVEDLVPIPSEFEGILDTMCDVHFDNNHTPLEAKDHVKIVINSNDDISSSDDDSLHEGNIEYVEASPHDSKLVILEAAEIVIPEVEVIEDDNLQCSSCGALYTTDYCCSDGIPGDKIICDLDKTPDLSQRPPQNCPKCGNPVDGHYCQGSTLLRNKFKEDLFTYCIENRILQDSSKPSNDNTNVVNALQEPFVVKQDPGKTSSQSPPQINHHCCYGCGDSLEDILCHQCTCELCGKGAHYGYNCPPKVPVVSNPEQCHNQNIYEFPQTVPRFDPTCYSKEGNSFTYDSKSNLVHDSPNVFNPPLQPLTYSYEFCGNDAYYGQECSLQVPFTYDPEPLYINTPNWDRPTVCYDDDDEDYTIAVTPILSTKEPDNSLSMEDEHLNTISTTESDEFIKSSVENLVPIPSESEGIPDNMCDVPFHDNSPPLDILKDQFKDFSDFNDDSTSYDYDSFSIDNIEYVEASPPNSELVSSEVMEIVIPKVGGINDDIILTIKGDILREKLLNVNLLISNIKALKDNPTPSFNFMTKSSSTSLSSLLEETNTFDNSLPEFETFYFDLEEISSVSTTTHSNISLLEYEAFYDDHVKDISYNTPCFWVIDDVNKVTISGSTTTHSDISLSEYDLFIFPHEEFVDELAHIISPPEIRENLSATLVNLPIEDDYSPLLAYVVWIFVAYLT
nr:hypothetical protein [Tanacetum cinerariifolium]